MPTMQARFCCLNLQAVSINQKVVSQDKIQQANREPPNHSNAQHRTAIHATLAMALVALDSPNTMLLITPLELLTAEDALSESLVVSSDLVRSVAFGARPGERVPMLSLTSED